MKKKTVKTLWFSLVSLLLIIGVVLVSIFQYGFYNYKIESVNTTPQKLDRNWEAIFKRGKAIQVIAMNTGYAVAQPHSCPYLNPNTIPKDYDMSRVQRSPIYCYAVRYPNKGDLLIDSGLDQSFHTHPPHGNLPLMLRLYQIVTRTSYRQKQNQNLGYWLKHYKLHPRKVLLTHVHQDHFCGLSELDRDVEVLFGKKETGFLYKAAAGKYLKGKLHIKTINFDQGIPVYPFSKVVDVSGDQTIWAISSPGHTVDHISYLINVKDHPVLLIGDLSVSKYHLINNIEVSSDKGPEGYRALQKSLNELKTFKQMYPQVKIYFSHSSWTY